MDELKIKDLVFNNNLSLIIFFILANDIGLMIGENLYPNGSYSHYKGCVSLFISLISKPVEISQISALIKFTIQETNNSSRKVLYFRSCRSCGTGTLMKTNDLQNLNQLTINLEIMILDLYNINGLRMDNYIKEKIINANPLQLVSPVIYKYNVDDFYCKYYTFVIVYNSKQKYTYLRYHKSTIYGVRSNKSMIYRVPSNKSLIYAINFDRGTDIDKLKI